MNQVLNLMGYGSGTLERLREGANSGTTTNDSQEEYSAPAREAASLRHAQYFLSSAYVRVRSIAVARNAPAAITNERATASQKSGS